MVTAQWTRNRICRLERVAYLTTRMGKELTGDLTGLFTIRDQLKRSCRRAIEDLQTLR